MSGNKVIHLELTATIQKKKEILVPLDQIAVFYDTLRKKGDIVVDNIRYKVHSIVENIDTIIASHNEHNHIYMLTEDWRIPE